MPTVTPTREDKVEDYIRLSAAETFMYRIGRFLPHAVRDEIDLDELVASEQVNQLVSELWPEDEDLGGAEYQAASEKERLLTVGYLIEFGQLVHDYLLSDMKELVNA